MVISRNCKVRVNQKLEKVFDLKFWLYLCRFGFSQSTLLESERLYINWNTLKLQFNLKAYANQ